MIVKRKHSGSFAVVPNLTVNDEQLSADALGVLVWLLAKPADWKVSVAGLRTRFGIGRDRVYAILKQLEAAGFVQKRQARSDRSQQFCSIEYWVFDTPETAKEDIQREPLLEIPETGQSISEEAASGFAVSGSAVSGKSGHIQKTDFTKPSSKENSASSEAGADAPSASSKVWKEGRELLNQSSSQPNPSIIGKWLKRTPSGEGKEKLLAMIRAARNAGTGDPISYVTKALDKEFPPPRDPTAFDRPTWQRKVQAAINTKDWPAAWGPRPGKKGCLLPADLVSPLLLKALSERRIAA